MQFTINITRGHLMSTAKIITLGLLLGLGIQFLFAWTAPSGAAPTGNVAGPLTTGSNQTKSGSLTVSGGLTAPMLVDSDMVNGNFYNINPSATSRLIRVQIDSPIGQHGLIVLDSTGATNSTVATNDGSINVNDIRIRSINDWASNLATKTYVDTKVVASAGGISCNWSGWACLVAAHNLGGGRTNCQGYVSGGHSGAYVAVDTYCDPATQKITQMRYLPTYMD
jgi:hypothetical protein